MMNGGGVFFFWGGVGFSGVVNKERKEQSRSNTAVVQDFLGFRTSGENGSLTPALGRCNRGLSVGPRENNTGQHSVYSLVPSPRDRQVKTNELVSIRGEEARRAEDGKEGRADGDRENPISAGISSLLGGRGRYLYFKRGEAGGSRFQAFFCFQRPPRFDSARLPTTHAVPCTYLHFLTCAAVA